MVFGKVYSYGLYPFMWLWVLYIYVVMGFSQYINMGLSELIRLQIRI